MLSKRSDSGFFPVAVFCTYSTNLFTSNLISAQNKHKADTLGVKDGTEWRRTEECRWTGIRTEGSEEQQVPHGSAPFSCFVPALSLQQFKKQIPQIRPMGGESADQRAANPRHSDSLLQGESEEGEAVHAVSSSRWIGHEGPDIPPQCNTFSLIDVCGFAPYGYLHSNVVGCDIFECQGLLFFRKTYKTQCIFFAPGLPFSWNKQCSSSQAVLSTRSSHKCLHRGNWCSPGSCLKQKQLREFHMDPLVSVLS